MDQKREQTLYQLQGRQFDGSPQFLQPICRSILGQDTEPEVAAYVFVCVPHLYVTLDKSNCKSSMCCKCKQVHQSKALGCLVSEVYAHLGYG